MWITVSEHEMGLRFRHGKMVARAAAGRHWVWGGRHAILKVDTRTRAVLVGGQEVPTADGASVKVSLLIKNRVADVEAFYRAGGLQDARQSMLSGATTPEMQLHYSAQIALRDWVISRTLKQVLDEQASLEKDIAEPIRNFAKEWGIIVDGVQNFGVTVAGGLKAAYTELIRAELEGQVALTRARNEAATMRSLLNTARLVNEHPGLLELRVLTSGQKPRVSFVVGQPIAQPKLAIPTEE